MRMRVLVCFPMMWRKHTIAQLRGSLRHSEKREEDGGRNQNFKDKG